MSTIIFDFDGTLADTFDLVLDIAHDLTGIGPLSDTDIKRLRRMPIMKAVRELGIPLRRVPHLLLAGRQAMHGRMQEIKPFPGVTEALQALRATGHELIIMSSNSEQNVRIFLRSNNLEQYFDKVYGGAGLLNKATALRKMLRKDHIDRATCFYVGDEVRDIIAATKVHIQPISVSWGYQAEESLAEHHPYALVRHASELPQVLNRV